MNRKSILTALIATIIGLNATIAQQQPSKSKEPVKSQSTSNPKNKHNNNGTSNKIDVSDQSHSSSKPSATIKKPADKNKATVPAYK